MNAVKMSIKWGSLILALVSANSFAQSAPDGTIMIEKVADGGGDTEFSFTGTLGEFTLTDQLAKVSQDLAAGTYTITESHLDGWHVARISCDLENDAESTYVIYRAGGPVPTSPIAEDAGFDEGDDTVTITLAANETVECHYVNAAEGQIKIIKRVTHNGFERIPSAGFPFAADLAADGELEDLFVLRDGTIKLFNDAPIGENTFYELAPFVTNLNDEEVESTSWDITAIECRCVKTVADEECESTWSEDLENNTLDVESSDRVTLGSVTVDLKGGELVICEVFNEDAPCPPGTGSSSGGDGSSNNNNGASSAGTNAGLATTDVGSSAGGCSSTGTGVAGLTTILMLLSSLVGVRAMRRVRVKN